MKRICLCLLALLLLGSLFSCSSVKPEDSRVVMTLDGEKIYYDYYMYICLNLRDDTDGGDHRYFENNPEAQITLADDTLEQLLRNKAILNLADRYDISLTKEEEKKIDEELSQMKGSYADEAAYDAAQKKAHMTDYCYFYISTFNKLWSKLYEAMTTEQGGIVQYSDETILQDIPLHFRCIRYLQFEGEDRLSRAQDAMARLKSGEDLGDLIREYNASSPYLETQLERYYTTGELESEELADAVEELAEGEISNIFDTGEECCIIERLPVTAEYADSHFEEFRIRYCARIFHEMIEEEMAKIKVEYKDTFREINVFSE